MELTDLIDQLRLYDVEVLWVTALRVGALWSATNRLLILSVTHDHQAVRHCSRQYGDPAVT